MRPDAHWLERAHKAAARRYPDLETTLDLLPPHGSLRRYARVSAGDASAMLMLLPDADAITSDAGTAHPEIVADEPFIAVANWLEAAGVDAPRVLEFHQDLRVIWITDLGRITFFDAVQAGDTPRTELYERALDLLDRFQNANAHPEKPAIVQERALDATLLRWELDHYVDWRLEQKLALQLDDDDRSTLARAFNWITAQLLALPQVTVHRDFQSQNLMRLDDGQLALLDFQDALQGPLPYDAVALLRDSYIALDDDEFHRLVDRWAVATAAKHPALRPEDLVQGFHLQTIQRKLKDTGRFELFDMQKGQPEYLKFQPASLRYVRNALRHFPQNEALQELDALLRRRDPLYP